MEDMGTVVDMKKVMGMVIMEVMEEMGIIMINTKVTRKNTIINMK